MDNSFILVDNKDILLATTPEPEITTYRESKYKNSQK